MGLMPPAYPSDPGPRPSVFDVLGEAVFALAGATPGNERDLATTPHRLARTLS